MYNINNDDDDDDNNNNNNNDKGNDNTVIICIKSILIFLKTSTIVLMDLAKMEEVARML